MEPEKKRVSGRVQCFLVQKILKTMLKYFFLKDVLKYHVLIFKSVKNNVFLSNKKQIINSISIYLLSFLTDLKIKT